MTEGVKKYFEGAVDVGIQNPIHCRFASWEALKAIRTEGSESSELSVSIGSLLLQKRSDGALRLLVSGQHRTPFHDFLLRPLDGPTLNQ